MTALERLLDLVVLLLSARHPVPAREIFEALPEAYGGAPEARERKLSRDKAELRALGLALDWVEPDDDHEEGGYVIDRTAIFLPALAFPPEERAALLAAGAAALKGALPLRRELALALTKLRATGGGEDLARPRLYATTGRVSPHGDLLARAVAERRRVTLVYPPEPRPRTVRPYALSLRHRRLTLVAHCELRGGVRTFHADRISRAALASPDGSTPEFELPAGFDATEHLPRHGWQLRIHPEMQVNLTFAPELAESGPQALGFKPGAPIRVTNLDGLLAAALALGDGVTVSGPPEARQRMAALLTRLAGRYGEAP